MTVMKDEILPGLMKNITTMDIVVTISQDD